MSISNHPKPVYAGPTPPVSLRPVLDESERVSYVVRRNDGWLVRVLRRLFD
jgi:hypothetical protein